MKNAALFILFFLPSALYAQGIDTFEVFFALNEVNISKSSEGNIDQLIFKDKLIHGQKLIVLGYADYLGDNKYNDALSLKRATNVQNYLVSSGFDKKDIKLCIGKGKIEREPIGKDGHAADRKVQIIIDKEEQKVTPTPVKTIPKLIATIPKPKPTVVAVAQPVVLDAAKLKVNDAVALKNINFQPGTDLFLPEARPALEDLLYFLNTNKSVQIRIEGHICCVGNIEGVDQNELSVHRAAAVLNYLVSNGIDQERLSSVGLGNRNPISREELTEDDRILNRRVEIRILSK